MHEDALKATVFAVPQGKTGCGLPLPKKLRDAANELSGQRLDIQEIIDALRKSVKCGEFSLGSCFISYGSGRQIWVPRDDKLH